MAIQNINDLVAGLVEPGPKFFQTQSFTNVAGGFVNMMKAGSPFGTFSTPAAASAGGTLHVSSNGGLWDIDVATAGLDRYLAQFSVMMGAVGTLFLYDRVWSCSGLVGNVATAQAVTGFPTLVRPTSSGGDLELWIECYTALGATASNLTVQYTNSWGSSGRNSISIANPTSLPANRMYRCSLQGSDAGVRSVQSVTLSASTGTAGNFGVTLMRRIAQIHVPVAYTGVVMDFAQLGLPAVYDYAALQFVHLASATASGLIMGSMQLIEG